MSPPVRSIGSSSSGSGGVTKFMKSLYRDEFRWSLIKSVGLFALGIAIARDDDHDDSLALFKCCMIRHIQGREKRFANLAKLQPGGARPKS